MSRELYRARAKKVQKMGRDGLVEQDRSTGQEQRISYKAADVSFGPERRKPEQAAPARTQQRSQQRKEYQREVRQAEDRTENFSGWETSPDIPAAGGAFSDAPVLDEYFPDTSAPEIPDAALSMRGAVDTPMMATPAATQDGPVLVRLRPCRTGKEKAKEIGKEPERSGRKAADKGFTKDVISPRQNEPLRRTEGGNRLKFDGERRLSSEKSPAQPEGDAKSPSLRGADDKPLAERPLMTENLRPTRYRSDTGGRLRFDAERTPEEKSNSRTAQKKQAVRQFASDAGTEDRLHFESAKPLSSGGTVPDAVSPRVMPDSAILPDMQEDDTEQQTEAVAVEAAVNVVVPVMNALRRPAKPKADRKKRLQFGRKQEDESRPADDATPHSTTDDLSDGLSSENLSDTLETDTQSENSGRLRFERDETPNRNAPDNRNQRVRQPVRRNDSGTATQTVTSVNLPGSIVQPFENRERLRFEREPGNTPFGERITNPERNKRQPKRISAANRPLLPAVNPQREQAEPNSEIWTLETVSEPLCVAIDGEVVQAEVIDKPPKSERQFKRRSDRNRDAGQSQKRPGTADKQARRFALESETAAGSRFQFESGTQKNSTALDVKIVDDFHGTLADSTSFDKARADAIDVEFRPVEPPVNREESGGVEKKRPRKREEQRPPANRMEDGTRLRFDAEWNSDSGSQEKKGKPETAKKKRPFQWRRAAVEPQKPPTVKQVQTAESKPDSQKSEVNSRLHFEEKPAKLTDESQLPRKGPRLMFGIGKNVKAADPGKSVQKDNSSPADSNVVRADQKGLSRRIGQRQEVRKDNQVRKSPPVAQSWSEESASRSGSSVLQETPELLTRTRRKPQEKPGIDTETGDKTDSAEQSKKRQRLQFEPELHTPNKAPDAEGYTRNPTRQTENESAEQEDNSKKKPRLRFEEAPPGGDENPSEKQQADTSNPPNEPPRIGDKTPQAEPQKPLSREDRQVSRAEKRVEKASRRLEKAQSKIPVKRRIKLAKQYDESVGKVKHRLQFEKEPVPEGASTLPLPMRGISGAANSARVTLLLKGHQKVSEVERQNVGVEAGHKGEIIVEQGVSGFLRWNYHRLRTKPYRAVRQAERALEREQVNLEWRRTLRDHPELKKKHALAKWVQKQRMKRKYAAAAREAKKTEQHTQYVLNETGQIIRATAKYIAAKKSVLATAALLGLIVLLFSTGLTSCMAMLSSFQSSYISISYMADEEDICEADLYYSEMETDLQIDIDETEMTHPGYDEYRYNIGEIGHNPFQLLSFLSTKYNAFKFRHIKSNIESLFWEQYTLTRTVIVETRYDSDDEPYDWYVLVTTLTVRPLASLISEKLDAGEETTRYGLYMQTCGNRQAYGNPFNFTWLGRVSSLYGYRKHPMTSAKNLHRGVDIGAPTGTEIHAIQDGRVVTAGEDDSYGLYVVIEGEKGYSSLYAHCSRLDVHAGQRVNRGDVIAAVGSTGDSTGPHLHLETKLDGEYLNPLFFVDTGGEGDGIPGGGGGVVIPGYPGEPPTDETYARMLAEAEKYLGYPYVWGGSSPSTSFDCSGFVSWVINHSGWNVGRLGAQALCNLCTPVSPADARPGDLVFFRYTYNAPIPDGVTHCGIYVGNNQMIHCGSPISYTNLTSSYWQAHFYCYGRLPNP